MFNEQGVGEIYLPEGSWTEFFSDEVTAGGRWIRKKYDYCSLPLYVRENTILAYGARDDGPEYDYSENVTFCVYGIKEQAGTKVYGRNGSIEAEVIAEHTEKGLLLRLHTSKPCTIVLKNLIPKEVRGACFKAEGNHGILENPEAEIFCSF